MLIPAEIKYGQIFTQFFSDTRTRLWRVLSRNTVLNLTYPLLAAPFPGGVDEVHRDGGDVVDGVLVAVSLPVLTEFSFPLQF